MPTLMTVAMIRVTFHSRQLAAVDGRTLPAARGGSGQRARARVSRIGDRHLARPGRSATARASGPAGVAPTLGAENVGVAGSDTGRGRRSVKRPTHRSGKCRQAPVDRRNGGTDGRHRCVADCLRRHVAGAGDDAHRVGANVLQRRCDAPCLDGRSLCTGHDRGPGVDGLALGRRVDHAPGPGLTCGVRPLVKPRAPATSDRLVVHCLRTPFAPHRSTPHSARTS